MGININIVRTDSVDDGVGVTVGVSTFVKFIEYIMLFGPTPVTNVLSIDPSEFNLIM